MTNQPLPSVVSEAISVLDIFKIGVGPSSSHTLGPWRAALLFLGELGERLERIKSLRVDLYGSLAKTGKGHGTDVAVLMGLSGEDPVSFDVSLLAGRVALIREEKGLVLGERKRIDFDPDIEIVFRHQELLPVHPNGLKFEAVLEGGEPVSETYYSVGGGFVVRENGKVDGAASVSLPYPVKSAGDLLRWCSQKRLSVSGLVWENEKAWRGEEETRRAVEEIWRVMCACIYQGCHHEGVLPGGFGVVRRAAPLSKRLIGGADYTSFEEWQAAIREGGDGFNYILDWVSCFALAVNEENASFARVVTAPTNGAAGVIPAVLQYLITFSDRSEEEVVLPFLLCASEIGSIFKKGATISAAMGGCQAEIGVSSAMAAAALTECRGGSVRQCLMAAEIAMEHHLGLTCDPVGGLVQVPCIERNTMGAIKAITAAQLALSSDPAQARVSLDAVVKTMWETAQDMNAKYKETSDGGLAVNIPMSLSEC